MQGGLSPLQELALASVLFSTEKTNRQQEESLHSFSKLLAVLLRNKQAYDMLNDVQADESGEGVEEIDPTEFTPDELLALLDNMREGS